MIKWFKRKNKTDATKAVDAVKLVASVLDDVMEYTININNKTHKNPTFSRTNTIVGAVKLLQDGKSVTVCSVDKKGSLELAKDIKGLYLYEKLKEINNLLEIIERDKVVSLKFKKDN